MKYKYTRKEIEKKLDAFYFRWQGEWFNVMMHEELGKMRDDLLAKAEPKEVKPTCSEWLDKTSKCIICKKSMCSWYSLCDEHVPTPVDPYGRKDLCIANKSLKWYAPDDDLPNQIDIIRKTLNQVVERVNKLSK